MLVQPSASTLVHFCASTAVTQHAQIVHCHLQCRVNCEPACWYSLVLQAAQRCTTTAQHAQILHCYLQCPADCHLTTWSSRPPMPHRASDHVAGREEQSQ